MPLIEQSKLRSVEAIKESLAKASPLETEESGLEVEFHTIASESELFATAVEDSVGHL